jgi:CRP/FNR family transcriptional regulator, cyclic AMP receptor protein
MHTLNLRSNQNISESIYSPTPRPAAPREEAGKIFRLKHNGANGGPGAGGEGYQKLKNRLISRGIPESIVDELTEQPTIVSYNRGSFIFLQGAPTDLLFWVSSGLVDILCPGPDGEQIRAGVLGPGDIFGFLECTDERGRAVQALQARARTNVQIGLLIRDHVGKVLMRQDPMLLLHIIGEVVAAWSKFTLHYIEFLGVNYSERLEIVLRDLATKFGVKESRGILLIPEFGHSDFAEMIGCSRPMVSRLIAGMISAGRLAQNGKHYILIDDSASKNGKQSS